MLTLYGRPYTWTGEWHHNLIMVHERYPVYIEGGWNVQGVVIGIWPYEWWEGPSYLIEVKAPEVGWQAPEIGHGRYLYGYHDDTVFI